MPLTDLTIKNAKPAAKTYKVSDGGSLYIEISPAGSKLWRMKYRFDGKEKRLSFGKYPYVGLKDAREKREAARTQLANGIDPGEHKKAVKAERLARATSTFEAVAREWFERMMSDKAPSHKDKVIARLQNDVFPWLGDRPIADITGPEILRCLQRIENRGARDTAHRAMENCGAIFRYAVASGRTLTNPVPNLKGALKPAKAGHFAAVTDPRQVGPLLRKMDEVGASFSVKAALRLAPYLFCRPGELRMMRWDEVHLDAAEWRYTVGKTTTPHLVPLASQAVAILRELLTVFPDIGCFLSSRPAAWGVPAEFEHHFVHLDPTKGIGAEDALARIDSKWVSTLRARWCSASPQSVKRLCASARPSDLDDKQTSKSSADIDHQNRNHGHSNFTRRRGFRGPQFRRL
jgi:integrase